uniref:Protein kinase domain-containing protein n=1 Tax=Parascaris univalens TaxID=6257 RepID=A0A915B9L1_PARUN
MFRLKATALELFAEGKTILPIAPTHFYLQIFVKHFVRFIFA